MKNFRNKILACAIALGLAGSAFAAPYTIDKESSVKFTIKHLKLSSVPGNFKEFSGDADFDAAKNTLNALNGVVAIKSVDTQNQKRDEHLNAADIFDSAKYPQMSFKMTKYAAGKITGDLTIKGTTKSITLNGTPKNEGGKLKISAKGQIKRSDFGVVWESSLKDSMVSDEVEIILDLVASPK